MITERLPVSLTFHSLKYERMIPVMEGFFREFFLGGPSVAGQHQFIY
jgi:hypothetical protein